MGNFMILDGGMINLCYFQFGCYICDIFMYFGMFEMVDDLCFFEVYVLMENWEVVGKLIVEVIGVKFFDYWCEYLKMLKGQWVFVQSVVVFVQDEQVLVNDMIFEVEGDGGKLICLVCSFVQFDYQLLVMICVLQVFEYIEIFFMEFGLEWDEIE